MNLSLSEDDKKGWNDKTVTLSKRCKYVTHRAGIFKVPFFSPELSVTRAMDVTKTVLIRYKWQQGKQNLADLGNQSLF